MDPLSARRPFVEMARKVNSNGGAEMKMINCTSSTSAGKEVQSIYRVPEMEMINCTSSTSAGKEVQSIYRVPEMEMINCTSSTSAGKEVQSIYRVPEMEMINCTSSTSAGKEVQSIYRVPEMEMINCTSSTSAGKEVQSIYRVPEMEMINCTSSTSAGKEVQSIYRVPEMEMINCTSSTSAGKEVQSIYRVPEMEMINCTSSTSAGKKVPSIYRVPKMEMINCTSSTSAGKEVQSIYRVPEMEMINCTSSTSAGKEVQSIYRVPEMEMINCTSSTSAGKEVQSIYRVPEMEMINCTSSTSAGKKVPSIYRVPKMEMINCTSSTSAGKEVQSIYRVPEWLKNPNNMKAYQPQVMALGPFHNGALNLRPMEEHKYRAEARRLIKSGKPLQAYIAAIDEVAKPLQAAYGKDLDKKWRGVNRPRFVEMMVRDGCFLLELISLGVGCSNCVPDSGSDGDIFFSDHNYMYMQGAIISDVLAMENQLPLLLLQRLLAVHYGTTTSALPNEDVNVEDQTDTKINLRMLLFLGRYPEEQDWPPEVIQQLGLHPLDLYHSSLTYGVCGERTVEGPMEEIMPCAVKIHEAGVHFDKSQTDSLLDVRFERGVLSMPELMVDDSSEGIFLNLLAFEHQHAAAGNGVTAYVFFMDNIIDTAEDVSLLKAKGIVNNYLGSDDALAKLVNDTLSKGAVLSPFSVINKVQHDVKDHCSKPWNKWRANFMHTYLRNPWVFISLIAASILLLATILQTVYTVVAFYHASASRSPDIN